MVKAERSHRNLVAQILTNSFDDNKSVNFIVKQDHKRKQRIKRLMEYSFDVCHAFGEVFLSDDKKGCALIVFPDKKKTTLKSVLWDIRLIILCMGLFNLWKAIERESKIKKGHPKSPFSYLWFIGVDPGEQNKGTGSGLLREILEWSGTAQRPVYLETSTVKNLPFYEKFGFVVYRKLDFGYTLFCLKKDK